MPLQPHQLSPPTTSLVPSRFEHLIIDWDSFLADCIAVAEPFVADTAPTLDEAEAKAAAIAYVQFLAWRFLCESGEDASISRVGSVSIQKGNTGISACGLADKYAGESATLMGVDLSVIVGSNAMFVWGY